MLTAPIAKGNRAIFAVGEETIGGTITKVTKHTVEINNDGVKCVFTTHRELGDVWVDDTGRLALLEHTSK
jgi:hypothetical protein